MANETGAGFESPFREGDVLKASVLQRIFDSIARRFVGVAPLSVKPGGGVITFAIEGDRDRRVVEKTILATLDVDNGDGTYSWLAFSRGPAETEVLITNQCTEVNGVVGIASGTVVVLRKEIPIGATVSVWFFAAGGAPDTPGRITGQVGSTAVYTWIETDYPGGPDKAGASAKQATESNGSVAVAANSFADMTKKNGNFYFFFPVKVCGNT